MLFGVGSLDVTCPGVKLFADPRELKAGLCTSKDAAS